ncbi:MAG TPA: hypothetical protein VF829_02445 [Candidatus Paceibacterota bacterium]
MSRRTLFQLALLVAVFALSVSLQSLAAFSEPSSAPPAGNAYAPLTTSPNLETKPGNLNVRDGYMQAYNSNSGSYGLLNYGGYGLYSNSPTYTSGDAYAHDYYITSTKTWVSAMGGTPTGAIMAFYLSSCPSGWVLANGSNGTPDLRGAFVRGMYGSQNSRDGSRSLGSYQADEMQGHFHAGTTGGSSGGFETWRDPLIGPSIGYTTSRISAGVPITDPNYGSVRYGNETRPKNVALIYCMKQ